MATLIRRMRAGSVAFAAGGAIQADLSPTPFTITRMYAILRTDVTTSGSPGTYNDPWDRIIASLTLTGQNAATYFGFTDLRLPYHMTRLINPWVAARRPTAVAASQTNNLKQILYCFHFGIRPVIWDEQLKIYVDNPFDLTAGIPPAPAGNLSLGGAWGAAAAPGSGWTVNNAPMDIYFDGVAADAGDPPSAYQPQMVPEWTMQAPGLSGTSGAFQTPNNVPSGDVLHSVYTMTTRGTNAPRANDVLNSIQLYDNTQVRPLISFGGQSGVAADYQAAEMISQLRLNGAPPSDDNTTLGVPSIADNVDRGLIYWPVHTLARKGGNPFGADLSGINTGDLTFNYGVANATNAVLEFLYRKYRANPAYAG